jgi:hypothetical protein
VNLPRVTDHAVLRYLERAKDFDIEAVRAHIAITCAAAASVGAANLPAEGVKFALDKGVVVTVRPDGGPPCATHIRRAARRPGA